MVILTSREVLAELKKLGINTPSELKSYLKEYAAYFAHQYLGSDFNSEKPTTEEHETPQDSATSTKGDVL